VIKISIDKNLHVSHDATSTYQTRDLAYKHFTTYVPSGKIHIVGLTMAGRYRSIWLLFFAVLYKTVQISSTTVRKQQQPKQ